MSPEPTTRPRKLRRRTVVILLAIAVLLLFAINFSQAAFNLKFVQPDSNQQILILVALSAVIFLLLVALTFVLLRTLFKLYEERQAAGSRFRSKMVLGALMLSFAPVIFLFLFAYGLMNRSIDKWFSRPVEEVREDTAAVEAQLENYAAQNAVSEAQSMAASPDVQKAFSAGKFSFVINEFRRHELTLQGGFAVALLDGEPEASLHLPESWAVLRPMLPPGSAGGVPKSRSFTFQGTQYITAVADVGEHGRILVAMPLPREFSRTMRQIETSQRNYLELAKQRKLVRRTYMGLLLLLTVLVLFAATWFALFLSKLVTRPVAALAAATREISEGRFEYRVKIPAGDELRELVDAFNRMAEQLEASRLQIVASSRELGDANVALEQRRKQIETILESIPTGVMSVDAELRVTHTNHALTRIFRPQNGGNDGFMRGSSMRELFAADVVTELLHLMRRADRMGSATTQMEVTASRNALNVAVTVASLQHEGQRLGYVIVFEDLSDLLRAQKQAAWREVARRVAHEIKNPLTPIALSAERILRHLERSSPPDDASLAVIHGCAETIAGSVETVRTLVDEFSMLARFPTSQPQPSDINSVIETALAMFDGRLERIHVQTSLAPDLPKVMADPEAIKRAVANLVDNAAEAMQDSLLKEVQISTALLGSRDLVEIVIADTGHGVTRELKEKLFLPYFSTKKRGTGLGLAIVSRIIEDHRGSIRVEENSPIGTRFIVELPVAPEAVAASHA